MNLEQGEQIDYYLHFVHLPAARIIDNKISTINFFLWQTGVDMRHDKCHKIIYLTQMVITNKTFLKEEKGITPQAPRYVNYLLSLLILSAHSHSR